MRDDLGHFRQKDAVGNNRQADNISVLASDKLHVREKSIGTRPSRKCICMDQQPGQFSIFRVIRIYLFRQFLKISSFQRRVSLKNEYSFWFDQSCVKHGFLL